MYNGQPGVDRVYMWRHSLYSTIIANRPEIHLIISQNRRFVQKQKFEKRSKRIALATRWSRVQIPSKPGGDGGGPRPFFFQAKSHHCDDHFIIPFYSRSSHLFISNSYRCHVVGLVRPQRCWIYLFSADCCRHGVMGMGRHFIGFCRC